MWNDIRKYFGFSLTDKNKKSSNQVQNDKLKRSFSLPDGDDDALNVEMGGGFFGHQLNLDGTTRNDIDLIYKYREMSMHPECQAAIDDIVCEAIVTEDSSSPVKIVLDKIQYSDNIKQKISKEFENILSQLEFNTRGYDIFRKWFIDGKLFYHIIINEAKKQDGIIELRYVDPVNITKIREFTREKSKEGFDLITGINEYYVYNKDGFRGNGQQGIRINNDAIAYVNSGLFDSRNQRTVGYLHNSIKPLNQLRMMEDAVVIYRLCLVGNTRVKTNSGYKYIKELSSGDNVYSFNTEGLQPTTVKTAWSNGIKDVYSVRSMHHEIVGTDNHPILVYNSLTKEVSYVDIKDLNIDTHYFVYEKPNNTNKNISFPTTLEPHVKLNNFDIFVNLNLQNKENLIKSIAKQINAKNSTVRNFVYGNQFISKSLANKILDILKLPNAILEERSSGSCQKSLNLPEFITPEFAMMFGFLIGDGSVSKNGITFAEGTDPQQNQKYADLLSGFFGGCRRSNSKTRKYANWYVNNTNAANLLRAMGFVTGAKNKRIPAWVWECSDEIKAAFIVGLCEADGHIKIDEKKGSWNCTLALSNEKLIEDVKELWSSLGLSSGHISHRIRPATTRVIGEGTMPRTESWSVFLSTIPLPKFEKIWNVEYVGQEEVFDIEVDHEKHNFIANSVVVHNSRAPERRIFYIDVGSLPKNKAEQYMRDLMNRHRNKLIYDANTGEIRDDRRQMSMLEDYWLPRREGGKGTEIKTLDGAQNLSELDDVLYFQKKLYQSLNVPMSRLLPEQKSFSIGKSTEISRDEIKFGKFISRLRNKFSELFYDLLKTQLVLKNIISLEEWEEIRHDIFFDFIKDSYFSELKQIEVVLEKVNVLANMEPYVGKYYSEYWVRRNILGMNDAEITAMDSQIQKENKEKEKLGLDPSGMNLLDPMGMQNTSQKTVPIRINRNSAINPPSNQKSVQPPINPPADIPASKNVKDL